MPATAFQHRRIVHRVDIPSLGNRPGQVFQHLQVRLVEIRRRCMHATRALPTRMHRCGEPAGYVLCSRHAWKHHLRHGRCGILLACAWVLGMAIGCSPPAILRTTQDTYQQQCQFMAVVDFGFLVSGAVLRDVLCFIQYPRAFAIYSTRYTSSSSAQLLRQLLSYYSAT